MVLLECALEKINDCAVPGQSAEQNSLCCICPNDVIFLANQFQFTAPTAAMNNLNGLHENYKILRLLFQFLNSLSMQSDHLKILQGMPQLLESAIGN